MNIALVSPYDFAYPGGVTAHISCLADNFTRMGHNVKIVTPHSNVHDAPDRDDIITVGRPFPIPMAGSVARITLSPRLAPKVKKILMEGNFDVVHIHEPLASALPITFLRFSKAVNIGTFHAYHGSHRGYKYGRRILNRWFRKLDGKIAVSRPAAEFVSQYFPGYYNIIPNGIDVSHFSADVAPIEKYYDGKINILFVGRMEKRKGLKHLVRAYAKVKAEVPDSRLIVVGPIGGDYEDCERIIAENGTEDVDFTGYVSYDDLPRYYRAADVFCSPAIGKESFGIVLLEAMAAARPIVATNIEGYASVMTHGVEGLLVRPKDEESLVQALVKLLNDEERRSELGAQGRVKAWEYDWPRVSQRVLSYYERILGEKAEIRQDTELGSS